jgi:hypothetical protein
METRHHRYPEMSQIDGRVVALGFHFHPCLTLRSHVVALLADTGQICPVLRTAIVITDHGWGGVRFFLEGSGYGWRTARSFAIYENLQGPVVV